MKWVKKARVKWYDDKKMWVIELWDNEDKDWGFSVGYPCKDMDKDGYGMISDRLLCELHHLQYDLGYTIEISV